MNANFLQTLIVYLKGVSTNRADVLKSELGIYRYQDLIDLFPNRYIDKTNYYKIDQLQRSGSDVQLVGRIIHIKMVEQKKGKRLVATFSDETGKIELIWFRGQKWIKENIKLNVPYIIFGKANWYNGAFSMPHPEMELQEDHKKGIKGTMQSIYPSTEKLTKRGITNRVVNKLMQQLFIETKGEFVETLSAPILSELNLISKSEALFNIHFPKNQEFNGTT